MPIPIIDVSVQQQDFNLSEHSVFDDSLNSATEIGAIASFVGKVRKWEAGVELVALNIEHYAGMTEKSIYQICEQAFTNWSLIACRVIHRVGTLAVGENIVLVAVASQHRKDAFSACEFIMDYLKDQAPFWKKAIFRDSEQWVQAKDSDRQAAEKWKIKT